MLCGCVSCFDKDEKGCINPILCERKDEEEEGYCDWSTCEGPCWHRAFPPENFKEMCLLGLDCCPFRCKKGIAETYFLLPQEREELQKLKARYEREKEANSVLLDVPNMPTEVAHLITGEIALDQVKEDKPPVDNRKANSLPSLNTNAHYSYPTHQPCQIM